MFWLICAASIIDLSICFLDNIGNQNIKLYFQVLNKLIHELESEFSKWSFTFAIASQNLYLCNYQLVVYLLKIYNTIFFKNAGDIQLLWAQKILQKSNCIKICFTVT